MSIVSHLLDGVWALAAPLGLLPLLLGAIGGDADAKAAEGADAADAADADAGEAAGEDAPGPRPDDPDHELVRLVVEGDPTAYRGLVERYQGRIYNVCYGMVRNREDARDLAQDAFVKAFKNLSRFRYGSSFYTWLCRIAMNVSIDHIRKQKVRKAQEFNDEIGTRDQTGMLSFGHHRGDPRRELERQQIHDRIMAALETLPDEQRQVVVLREMEGLSYKEISDVMGIPEGTVMSRLYYARKKLQHALAELHGP